MWLNGRNGWCVFNLVGRNGWCVFILVYNVGIEVRNSCGGKF